jgi:serine protease inhibitor
MKKIQKILSYGLIGLLLLTGCGSKTQPQLTANLKIAQEAFADGKLRELAWLALAQTGSAGNVCISPEGIAEALMIPQNAANAEKSQWIGDILGQNRTSQSRANEILRDLRRSQTSPGKGKWLTHWELFVGENRPVKESFLESCRKELELSSTFVQLQGDGANAYFARWVEDNTKGGISKVSWRPENPLALALAGVEYIAPLWENTMDSAKTLPSPFTSADGNQAAVPMMGVLE